VYRPPEQRRRADADGRADLYGLGVLLYELLTGRTPSSDVSPLDVAGGPPAVAGGRRVLPLLLPTTGALLVKALAPAPDGRFQTASEMRAALLEAGERASDAAAHPSSPGETTALLALAPRAGRAPSPAPPAPAPRRAPPPAADAPRPLPLPLPRRAPAPPAGRRPRSRSRLPLLLVPAAVLLAVLAGTVRPTGDPVAGPQPPPGTVATAPVPDGPPAPTAAAPTVAPAPTAPPAPVVPTLVPAPTAAPTAAPAAAPASSPEQAVQAFYGHAAGGRFDGAAGLWSQRMLVAYPPGENITQRFGETRELTVQRAEIVSVDEAAGRATVAVDLLEVVGSPPQTRRYVGTWQLVRGPGGWLLDQPNLRLG
jgi:serine/threonine-protein kinase